MSLAVDVIVIGVPGPQGVGTFAALTDVNFGSFIDKDFAQWDAGTAKLIGTPLSATAPLTFSPTTGVFTIPAASGAANGYLSSADWTIFNNKQAALGFTPINKAGDSVTGPLTFSTVRVGQLSGNFYGVGQDGQNQGFRLDIGTSFQPSILTREADGASAVAAFVDTSTAWSNATAKLWSWRTNAVEKAYVLATGRGVFPGITASDYVQGVNASGANVAGAALQLAGGQGTGSALGGPVVFYISPSGGSGSSLNAQAEAVRISRTNSDTFELLANGNLDIKGMTSLRLRSPNGTEHLHITSAEGVYVQQRLTMADNRHIFFSTSTGSKIGSTAAEKLAFWGATPVVQGAAVADASGGAVIDVEARAAINGWLARARTYGLIAT